MNSPLLSVLCGECSPSPPSSCHVRAGYTQSVGDWGRGRSISTYIKVKCRICQTISNSVKDFTISGIKDYKMIQVDRDSKLSDTLKCHFFAVKSHEKTAVLLYIMQELISQRNESDQTIIFCATRYHVEYLQEIT